MSAPEIYARYMVSENGFAPWFPGPVHIAEVGYVRHGEWERLFDASKERGDECNDLGVPKGYYPLVIGKVGRRTIPKVSFLSEGGTELELGVKASSTIAVTPQCGGQISFKFSKQQGAILYPGDDIETEDAKEVLTFQRYIRNNHASWLKFSRENCNRDISLIDLVLITGSHKTSSWACAAFTRRSSEINLQFNVTVGAAQGAVWGRWSETCSPGLYTNSGPMRPVVEPRKNNDERLSSLSQSEEAPMAVDDPGNGILSAQMEEMSQRCAADVKQRDFEAGSKAIRDQGIFIRGYKICDRRTWRARVWSRKRSKPECDKDGFTVLIPIKEMHETCRGDDTPGGDDQDTEGDPSGRHPDHPSGWSNNSSPSSSEGKGRANSSTSGRSDGNSSPSDSANVDHSENSIDVDEDPAFYTHFNCNNVLTSLEATLEYILENSNAELALAHDDDVIGWLQDDHAPQDPTIEIRNIRPRIFVVDQVGMLITTYLASLDDWPGKENVIQGTECSSALCAAGYFGHKSIVEAFLQEGASVKMQIACGHSLQHASLKGHYEIVRTLLDYRTVVNIRGGEHGSALLAAAYGGHESIVRLLLENGALVNMRGADHATALEVAALNGHESIVQLLLEYKAGVGNALQLALSEGHQGIAELLQKNGAVGDAEGRRGSAPYASVSMRTGLGLELAAAGLGSQAYHSMTTPDSQSDYPSSAMLWNDDGYKQEQQLPSLQKVVEGTSSPFDLYGTLRSTASYPSSHGYSVQDFQTKHSIIPATPPGIVRGYNIPDKDDDPRKVYKCKDCGKRFDRLYTLKTHSLSHNGDKLYACPDLGCDKSFSVLSNMREHYRKQHEWKEDNDHTSNRQTTYPATSSGSSPPSRTYYSSSRRH